MENSNLDNLRYLDWRKRGKSSNIFLSFFLKACHFTKAYQRSLHLFLTVVFLLQLSNFFVLLPAKEVEGEGTVNTLAMPSLY
jgi:hypothetical protein